MMMGTSLRRREREGIFSNPYAKLFNQRILNWKFEDLAHYPKKKTGNWLLMIHSLILTIFSCKGATVECEALLFWLYACVMMAWYLLIILHDGTTTRNFGKLTQRIPETDQLHIFAFICHDALNCNYPVINSNHDAICEPITPASGHVIIDMIIVWMMRRGMRYIHAICGSAIGIDEIVMIVAIETVMMTIAVPIACRPIQLITIAAAIAVFVVVMIAGRDESGHYARHFE